MTIRKKVLAVVCCMAVIIAGISATFAYFTDSEYAVNTFTVGKVDISLFEEKVENGQVTETTYEGLQYHLVPGETYSKMPHVRVEAGSEPCWLFVTVDNQLSGIEGGTTITSQMSSCSWEKLEGITVEDNGKELDVYAYRDKVAPAVVNGEKRATDVKVFDSFTVDGNKATNAKIAECEDKAIIIKAYAIQAAGFDTAAKAWEAAHTQF